jgi:hypothetical protein
MAVFRDGEARCTYVSHYDTLHEFAKHPLVYGSVGLGKVIL